MIRGNLILRPLSGKITHDTQIIGTMDPYVKVFVGHEIQTTKPATGQHKLPYWNNEMCFRITDQDVIVFEIWNKGTIKDDFIGLATLTLSACLANNTFSGWIPLRYNETQAGELLVEMQFFPDGGSEIENQGLAPKYSHSSKQQTESSNPNYVSPEEQSGKDLL